MLLLISLSDGCRQSSPRFSRAGIRPPQHLTPNTKHQTPTPELPSLLARLKPTARIYESDEFHPTQVSLTFDAGSDDSAVPILLRTLTKYHLHATFFLTGKFCEAYPRSCSAIASAGMEIGNHSYSHPHFTKLNREAIESQLRRAEAAIKKACGRGAKPLFRFPYGDSDRRTRAIVAAAGYQPIGWSLDSLDSVGKHKPAKYVANRILRKIRPGFVTLMHVSYADSARALPRIFEYLKRQRVQEVPVSQLLLASSDAEARRRLKTRRHKTGHLGEVQATSAAPAPSIRNTIIR